MPISVGQFYKTEGHDESDYYPRSRVLKTNLVEEKPCRACSDFKSWLKNQNVRFLARN